MAGKTLYDKLWDSHVVHEDADGTCLIYIDRHLVHEVTSPQAFEGLRLANRKPWRSDTIVANPDHNTPTKDWAKGIEDPISRLQVETLDSNIKETGALVYFPFKHANQGIIHVIGPENGTTLPGMTVVCGDSHTSTHGAFGALAHGIGTSEVEHGRQYAPKPADWDNAVAYWNTLATDADATFDSVVELKGADIAPQVTWGTSPEQVLPINGLVPDPAQEKDATKRTSIENALKYMGLTANTPIEEIKLDKIFIGSCTNSRIEDLRAAAVVAKGKKVASSIQLAMVVPGSGQVKRMAEEEGLDKIFIEAGFEWREPGCSMCLAMNADRLSPGERCASTSNRNFEGRQGQGGRTHLVSPAMAVAAAVAGHFVDVRSL
ncbi:unnamed protein product, partial [Darwinula stevensoni]